MNRQLRTWRWLLAAACAGLLAACGGGGDGGNGTPAPGATPQAATVNGTLTGFGSVVIDGVRYDDSIARAARDVDSMNETPATMGELKLGMQVEAQVDDDGKLTTVVSRATVVGQVQSIDAANSAFKVNGQTIKVVTTGDTKTVFEGYTSLADIKVADWVEVHGTIDADKNIVATRVEHEDASGMTSVRVGGIVKGLDTAKKTFMLGDLTIDYSAATLKPDNATLANDQFVFVYSTTLPANNALKATAIRIGRIPSLEGRKFFIGGLVTDYVSIANFKVNGVTVDAIGAEIKGGVAADIKNMALVRVEGKIVAGTAGAAPSIKATRVFVNQGSEQRGVLLIGQISDFVSVSNFKVRTVPVDASKAMFKNGKATDLANGTFVVIKGAVNGATVAASEVAIVTPPAGVPFRLAGTVGGYDAGAKTFMLLGITMKLDAAATFTGGTAADFANGKFVVVKGKFDGTTFVVTAVDFKTGATTPVVFTSGVASNVTATSVTVNGQAVMITAMTMISGGTLANGQLVDVVAQWVNNQLVAIKIEIEGPKSTARLQGPITDFKSAADFKVAGQSVDASAATVMFTGGKVGDLANGVDVRVYGDLVAGVVKATAVVFRD